MYSQMRIVLP